MNFGRRWRRLGARASRPRAASQGGAKAHQDAPHSPFAPCGSIAGRSQSQATDMNCGRRCRRLGARASRPRAASQGGKSASGRPARPLRPVWEHCGAIAIAGDRHELRSTLAPPGSAGVSPACAPEARAPRLSGRPTSPFAPCGSIAGRSQSRATEMNFGLRRRRLGARASRPRAASQGGKSASGRPARPLLPVWEHCGAIAIAGDRNEFRSTPSPPGSAGVSPACSLTGGQKRIRTPRTPPSPRVGALRGDRNRRRPT